MKIQEILEKSEFSTIRKEVDLYAETMLSQYIENLSDNYNYAEDKEIFDVIWGPVEFNAGEIVLLDSPVIQRLRKIKQLGLASYVYCGADYSRFAHTIGVFYLSGRMAEIINKHLKKEGKAECKYNFIQIVRLAALFHDSCHTYFSHVSEKYFEENEEYFRAKEMKKILSKFELAVDTNVSLHELLAVILVHSDSVKKLLKQIAPVLDGISIRTDEDLNEVVEYISCLIIGLANDEEILPYHQIINGPVDADKCDYLSRDSHATDVPVAVDIFRLIHKLSIELGDLPENIQCTNVWEGERSKNVYYPTIKSSAIEALNQLVMARAIMFNSVYYHQKVRTAETMLRKVMEELNHLKVPEVTDFTKILLMTDDIFGYYCYNILNCDNNVDKHELRKLTEKLNKINFRFLMKRACSIDKDTLCGDEERQYLFQKDIIKLRKADKIREIEEATKEEYYKICSLLKKSDKEERGFFLMEFPKVILSDSIPDAVISYGNGEVKKAADIFQSGTWIESKESRNKEQYLVTDCENRELAHLALQKVLFVKYGIQLKDSAAICSKVPINKIKKIKKELLDKGYYNENLQLVSELILSGFQSQIRELCEKFQTFEGAQGKTINMHKIKAYLEQFMKLSMTKEEINVLIDGIIRILQQNTYIDRKCFARSMTTVFEKIGREAKYIYLCPLGGEKDSAFHMMYYLNDLGKEGEKLKINKSLQDAIKNSTDGDRIVFFDDGAYSGMQVSFIIEEYMGVSIKEHSTDETHVMPLTEEEKETLKKRSISLAYICFNTENEKFILDNADKAGIHIENIEYMYDMKEKIFAEGHSIFVDDFQRDLVQKTFRNIGVEILESVKKIDGVYKENWSQERVEKSSLGYNDAQQAVILKSSVPTYTLTALWLPKGSFEGTKWEPLFTRTDK